MVHFSSGSSTRPCTNDNNTQSHSYDRFKVKKATGEKKRELVKLPSVPKLPFEPPQYDMENAAEPVRTLVNEVPVLSSYHFLTLPSEIRFMIYEILLISKGPIQDAHKLMGPQKSVFTGNRSQIKDIDATILRTSRSIYHEALQILYRKNRFYFSSPDAVETFAFCELPRPCVFGEKLRQYGRFTMVNKVYLRLGSAGSHILRTPGHPIDRELLWERWRGFFEPAGAYSYPPPMSPAVQTLVLDFRDWELDSGKKSELDVSPHYQLFLLNINRIAPILIKITSQVKQFVTKLRGHERLSALIMKGVVHQQNLSDFRSLLVKPEGYFFASDSRQRPIMCSRGGRTFLWNRAPSLDQR